MGVRKLAAIAAAHLVLLAFCTTASASVACPTDLVQPTTANADDAAFALLCDMNQLRQENGLKPLRWDWRLWYGAQQHATDMATRHYLSHFTLEGRGITDRIEPTGYIPDDPTWLLAENLGFGTQMLSSPLAIALGWMNSPPHRENLLDPEMRDAGVGIAEGPMTEGGPSGLIYVVDFGTRGSADSAQAGSVQAGTVQARTVQTREQTRTVLPRPVSSHAKKARRSRRR
jgi:uncharacterized protein YkwD